MDDDDPIRQTMVPNTAANTSPGARRNSRVQNYIAQGLRRFALEYHATGRKPDALKLDNLLELVSGAGVLVWVSGNRYTYAAVYANHRWFITGKGGWYGKNEFSSDEFLDVLLHDQVTSISFSQDFVQLYAPPPF